MKGKWEKTTAIFLTCILLFLSIAAEVSHKHNKCGNIPPTITKNESDVNDIKTAQNHSFICIACLYGLSHLAPNFSFQTLKPNHKSFFTILGEPNFCFITLFTSFNLRAPPVELV